MLLSLRVILWKGPGQPLITSGQYPVVSTERIVGLVVSLPAYHASSPGSNPGQC